MGEREKIYREYTTLMRATRDAREGRFTYSRTAEKQGAQYIGRIDNANALAYEGGLAVLSGDHPSKYPYRPLRYFTTLGDPSLAVFINDAKEKARHAYYALGRKFYTHEYVIDVAFVSIKFFGRLVHIRIMPADMFYFEFASSSNPVKAQNFTQETLLFNVYLGVHVKVAVMMIQGQMVAKSKISLQRRSTNTSDTSINLRPYQIELLNEPVEYPFPTEKIDRKRYYNEVYGSWAPGNPHTGVHLRNIGLGAAGWLGYRNPLSQHQIRDIGFDVPYSDSSNFDPIRNVFIRTNADYPRASAKQIVKSEMWGNREYGIFCDAFNQFHVFLTKRVTPTDPEDPYAQNVDNLYVRKLTPTLPSWCHINTQKVKDQTITYLTDGSWQVDWPELDWKFDHEGKRACTIAYERQAFIYDSALFDGPLSVGAGDPFTAAEFNTFCQDSLGIQYRHQATVSYNYNNTRYHLAPGIVEVTITITTTGAQDWDFEAAIEVREVRRPTTSKYCPMFVGYVWHDAPFGALVAKDKEGKIVKDERIAKIGDLVAMDIERYYDKDSVSPTDGAVYTIFSFKTIVGDGVDRVETEILTAPAAPVLAVDMTTLSYVQLMTRNLYSVKKMPRKSGDSGDSPADCNWVNFHYGAGVWTGGKLREILYPQGMLKEEMDAQRQYIETTWKALVEKPLTTRQKLQEWIDRGPLLGRKMLDLNDATTWATGNYGNWRLWYARSTMDAITGTHPLPGDSDAIERFLYRALYAYLPPLHLVYDVDAKFAWYAYADEICNYHAHAPDTTFYVHPSGSWAFWCNHLIYVPQGQPYIQHNLNTLSGYSVESIEHVVLDRVHFEMRTNHILLGKLDTSHLELYNKAVEDGLKNETLGLALSDATYDRDIRKIEEKDLRGVFAKDVYTYTTDPYSGTQWLALKLTWDGEEYWIHERGIQGGTYHLTGSPWPGQGALLGLTLNHLWSTNSSFTGNLVYPTIDVKHIRFANDIILQAQGL